jgi:hypothetical protein
MAGIRAVSKALGRVAKSNWTERAPKAPAPVVKINSANLKPNKIIKKNNSAAPAKTDAVQKNSVKVKPAAKQKANRPSMAKVEYKFGMGNNRMINTGVPLEARKAADAGRKNRIQANILNKKNKKAK